MKTSFQAMGPLEFVHGKESALWKSIEAKYASQLASATPFQKVKIKSRRQCEFLRGRKEGHAPSPGTLW
jgi:hypothetical protein